MTSLDARRLDDLSEAKLELLRRRLRGASVPRQQIPAHSETDLAPLSPAQRGVWILDHFLGATGLYNICQCLWLHGPLDAGALGQAFDDVIERQQVLRAYTPAAGVPVQHFAPSRPGALQLVDLTGVAAGQRHAEAAHFAEEAARQPFDLTRGPLVRVALLRLADERHLLVLTLHHLVCDERSMEVLQAELAESYAARLAGRAAELSPLPVHYRDYAAWQTARQDDSQLAYWLDRLSGLPPVLDFSADLPRPPIPSYRGDRVHLDISDADRRRVIALADRLSCSVFTVLLSGFAALTHRYSGQARIAVGTLLSGRDLTEVEDLVGLFARPAAVVAEFTDDPSFAALVARTHESVGGALAHQDVSFEQVVEALRPDRDLSANPLFQVLYQHEDTSAANWELPGLRVEPRLPDSVQAKVDLSLFTSDDGHTLAADLVFALDLFTRATAERILRHFGCLLADALDRPDDPVSRLRLLAPRERAVLLYGNNDTRADYPRDSCLHELFEAQAARAPEAVALTGPGGSVTYRELDERANRLAWRLRELGVRAEVPVGVCLEQGPDLFVALLGVLKAGGAYVPLDPAHPADRLAYILADTAATVVVTQDSLAGQLRGTTARTVRMDGDVGALARYPADALGRMSGPENLIYVMYTSGSTGRPKGVMISHRALNNYLWWAIEGYGLDGAHGAPMLGSIAFDLSIPNFFLPLIGGRDVTLLPPDRSLESLAELLVQPGDFSLLKITPAHMDVLRGHLTSGPPTGVRSVRTFVVGADEVKPETVAGWRRFAPDARMIDEYGPTETVVGCSTYEIPADFDSTKPVSIGRPIANMTMYVLDQHLEPVPPGVAGELYIGGDGVARGYHGRRALTAGRFLPDPYGEPGARFYRTGDLASVRPDGNLDFLGRSDHQVKIRGYRIELGEIEARLLLDPAVREAVVTAREDRPGVKRLIAYVVPGPAGADPGALREALRQTLPDYMVPAAIVMLPALPLSDGGKVDRRLLPAPTHAEGPAAEVAEPRTDQERVLARLWGELLDQPRVSVTDSFFELGGDSLLAIQLAVRARAAGLAVTPRLVFQHHTLEALARVAEPTVPSAGPAVPAPEPAEVPMSPSQLRLRTSGTPHEYYIPVVLLETCSPASAGDLERALHALVARHQALRLRGNGQASTLWVAPVETARLLRTATMPDDGPGAIAESLRADLHLAEGPLLRAALIRRNGPDWLMLAAHHFAVDGVSWQILLDELAALWPGAAKPLPAAGPPFAAWTRQLHAFAQSAELAAEAPYWLRREPDTAIPMDCPEGSNTADMARGITTALSAAETEALRRGHRAQTADLVLSALALTLTEWAGRASITVEVSAHGRPEIPGGTDATRTVGWLSCGYPFTLRPPSGRDPVSTLAAVATSRRQVPRSGIGYGLLRYLRQDEIARRLNGQRWPEVLVNPESRYRTGAAVGVPFAQLACAPDVEAASAGPRTHLLIVNTAVIDDQLTVEWAYSQQVHHDRTIRRLADDCTGHLRSLAGAKP